MVTRNDLHRRIDALPDAALPAADALLASLDGAPGEPVTGIPESAGATVPVDEDEEPFCLEDHLISPEEGWQILEEQAQETLGVSAEEFLRRYRAGEFDNVDTPGIIDLIMLVPLAR
jgi:hypothetical protein